MKFARIKKITHKTLVGFMALWLSGFVFLFCCGTLNAKAMATESCPLAKMSEHCDKTIKSNEDASVIGLIDAERVDCCGFLPAVFDKSRKIEGTKKQSAMIPQLIVRKFTSTNLADISPPFTAFQSRVPNRHRTFIKNCVFRI